MTDDKKLLKGGAFVYLFFVWSVDNICCDRWMVYSIQYYYQLACREVALTVSNYRELNTNAHVMLGALMTTMQYIAHIYYILQFAPRFWHRYFQINAKMVQLPVSQCSKRSHMTITACFSNLDESVINCLIYLITAV